MIQSSTQRPSTSPTELVPERSNTDSQTAKKISLAEMWAEGEHDESSEGEELKAPDVQNTDPEDPLGLAGLQEQQSETEVVRRFLEDVAECRARLHQPMRPLKKTSLNGQN